MTVEFIKKPTIHSECMENAILAAEEAERLMNLPLPFPSAGLPTTHPPLRMGLATHYREMATVWTRIAAEMPYAPVNILTEDSGDDRISLDRGQFQAIRALAIEAIRTRIMDEEGIRWVGGKPVVYIPTDVVHRSLAVKLMITENESEWCFNLE